MQNKSIIKLLLLLVLPIFSFAQTELEKIVLLNNQVEILAPKSLKQMTMDMWVAKYNNRSIKLLALSDEYAEVSLIGDTSKQVMSDTKLYPYKDFQIAAIKKAHPETVIIDSGVKVINAKKVAFVKFVVEAVDQKVYNQVFFTSLNGKLLFFSFNCIDSLRPTWEAIADEIMTSLKVK